MTEMLVSEKIKEVYMEMSSESFKIKNVESEEETINKFLDAINDYKKWIVERSSVVLKAINILERLTTLNVQSEKDLEAINNIISIANSIHRNVLKKWVSSNNFLHDKNYCKPEVKELKNNLDDFLELINDVDMIFFHLRRDQEFINLTNELKKVL